MSFLLEEKKREFRETIVELILNSCKISRKIRKKGKIRLKNISLKFKKDFYLNIRPKYEFDSGILSFEVSFYRDNPPKRCLNYIFVKDFLLSDDFYDVLDSYDQVDNFLKEIRVDRCDCRRI